MHSTSFGGQFHRIAKREVSPDNPVSGIDITTLLDKLLHKDSYDPRLRPNFDGKYNNNKKH